MKKKNRPVCLEMKKKNLITVLIAPKSVFPWAARFLLGHVRADVDCFQINKSTNQQINK